MGGGEWSGSGEDKGHGEVVGDQWGFGVAAGEGIGKPTAQRTRI